MTARVQPWLPQIVLVWLAGVMVVAVRPMFSWYTVRRLRRVGISSVGGGVQGVLQRTAARLRLARTVQVLASTLVQTPVVLGYFRPVVLLPVCVLAGLSAAQLESILAHELAHIRRHDYLVNVLQTLVETLFFYHPAVWWLSRQIRNERENCCDDVAMAAVGSRAEYGRALLAIEELRAASTALSLAARGGSLLARIRRIAGCEPAPRVVGGGSVLGAVLASMAVLGVLQFALAAPPQVKADPPKSQIVAETDKTPAKPAENEPPTEKAVESVPKTKTMRVQVVDEAKKPVSDVSVHASIWTDEKGWKANRDYRTDAQGYTVVELPRTCELVRLFVSKDAYVPLFKGWEKEWLTAGNRLPDEHTFTMRKGTIIGGVVKNDAGQPIAGVKVEVDCHGGNCLDSLAYGDDARITDAQGRWTLDNVPEGDKIKLSLRLNHPDYISDRYSGGLQQEQDVTLASLRAQTATIVMHQGISVTGTVTGADGKPVADAVVAWSDDPYFRASGVVGRLEVLTDARGNYRLPSLPAGPTTVTVMAVGWCRT